MWRWFVLFISFSVSVKFWAVRSSNAWANKIDIDGVSSSGAVSGFM